eukprot:Gb_25798 [translate_table: standard]
MFLIWLADLWVSHTVAKECYMSEVLITIINQGKNRHTGVVVYGNEYYFGGGIQHTPVGKTPYGKPLRVVELGITHVPKEIFEDYLQEISPRYTAETYSLLHHNCNNFSNELAQFLVGCSIPDFILRLPEEVTALCLANNVWQASSIL